MKKYALLSLLSFLTRQATVITLQEPIDQPIANPQILPLPLISEPVYESAPVEQVDPASLYVNQINGTKYGDNSIHCRNACKFGQVCTKKGNDVIDCKGMCGDKILSVDEQCDDGNTNAGDGCSSDCKREEKFLCMGEIYKQSKCTISPQSFASSRYQEILNSEEFADTTPITNNIEQNTQIIRFVLKTIEMLKNG